MQSENWFTSEIRSSFNNYKVMFIYILHAVLDSSTLKRNEHKNIKCSSENISFCWSFFEWQSSNKQQSNREYSDITRSHKKFHILSKIIKLYKKLLKSELFWSSNRIKMTANCIKNAKHFKNMKWLSKTQWS